MFTTTSATRRLLIAIPLLCGLFLAGCGQKPAVEDISGIWRADDASPAKNLVIEFVPDGTGKVFSGSIIGLPADAAIEWHLEGDRIHIETDTEEPVAQTMTLRSQTKNALLVDVNRSELKLVRVDSLMDEDAMESLP